MLGFDTETKTFIDGSGENSQQAAIVQLCGDDKAVYIFVLHQWTCMYGAGASNREGARPHVSHPASPHL